MNHFEALGRLTADPEISYSQGEKAQAIARFRIAVDRPYRGRDGRQETDFFSCVAFGKTAEFIGNYYSLGSRNYFFGRMQNNNYENGNGEKVYGMQFVVTETEFADSKRKDETGEDSAGEPQPEKPRKNSSKSGSARSSQTKTSGSKTAGSGRTGNGSPGTPAGRKTKGSGQKKGSAVQSIGPENYQSQDAKQSRPRRGSVEEWFEAETEFGEESGIFN